VKFDDMDDLETYGGTIVRPKYVKEDVVMEVTFPGGVPQLKTKGLRGPQHLVKFFAGLRDDPFIRGPRLGRNVAAIVVEMPLWMVRSWHQSTLLIWSSTQIPAVNSPIVEHAGRSLRSMFLENDVMNTTAPRYHYRLYGLVPDVVIFDTARPASYPNGRALTDDVVDLVGDPRVVMNDAPFPTANDKPFLATFPYLAEPH
jgi:hypothetical protein